MSIANGAAVCSMAVPLQSLNINPTLRADVKLMLIDQQTAPLKHPTQPVNKSASQLTTGGSRCQSISTANGHH